MLLDGTLVPYFTTLVKENLLKSEQFIDTSIRFSVTQFLLSDI
jgi:hypothetical protein